MKAFTEFKQAQKEGWAHFGSLETITIAAGSRLVQHGGVASGMRVLDVGCGTGVVAITAARLGAQVTGIDLTPQLLARARENSILAEVDVDWREGDAEELPFRDAEFDIVVSQFGHMFAPRPEVAVAEMGRVLKVGGTIAFSTWPPELVVGTTMALAARYVPPPSPGVPSPALWGDPSVVRQRLGTTVADIVFDRDSLLIPALSLQHYRANLERSAGPMVKVIEILSATDPEKLSAFRREFDAVVSRYYRNNVVHQGYLLTRARKI